MRKPIIYFSAALLVTGACAQSERNPSGKEAKEESFNASSISQESSSDQTQQQTAIGLLTSYAATDMLSDSLHRFVRKADLSFTTKDLLAATVGIEDLVRKRKGYIEYSGMRNETVYSTRVAVSEEEELQTSKIRPSADLQVRVPVASLDTFLRSLHPFVKVLHYRTVETENIAFETLLSRLHRGRIRQHSERTLGAAKSPDAAALDNLLQREMEADQHLVNELKTEERVQYASVSLTIKGTEYFIREHLPLYSDSKYTPSFWSRAGDSVADGWKYLVAFVLFLMRIWPLLLLGGAGWLFFRKYRRKQADLAAARKLQVK